MTREEIENSLEYQTAKEALKRYNIDKNFDIINFEEGSEFGYNFAINKACEWLYEYNRKQADKMFGTVHTADVTINVAEFRKAMEGGEE